MWESFPLGRDCDRCFTMGYSLLDFQCDLGQKAEPFSFLCFMSKLSVLLSMGMRVEWTSMRVSRDIREETSILSRDSALLGRAGVPPCLIWWQVSWEEEMSVFVVCLINRIDASEVWSDHSRLIHVLKVKQEEIFLCNLSSKSQKCFWVTKGH